MLEPMKNQSESWKSSENLFLKKGTNPGLSMIQLYHELSKLRSVSSAEAEG